MVPKVDDTQPACVRSLRVEDIVTIEDASVFVRDHASHIPEALQRRTWHVRGHLAHRQWREEAKRFSIRTAFWKKGNTWHASEEFVKYEVRRHVVAEL